MESSQTYEWNNAVVNLVPNKHKSIAALVVFPTPCFKVSENSRKWWKNPAPVNGENVMKDLELFHQNDAWFHWKNMVQTPVLLPSSPITPWRSPFKKTYKIHSKDKLQLITTCRLLFHQNPPWRPVSVNGCQFQGMLSNVSKSFMDGFEDDFLWPLDLQIATSAQDLPLVACDPTSILWWGVKCTHDHYFNRQIYQSMPTPFKRQIYFCS